MFRWLLALLLIASALVGAAIGVLNPTPVELSLIVTDWQAPLGAVVTLSVVIGVVLGMFVYALLVALPSRWRRRRRRLP